ATSRPLRLFSPTSFSRRESLRPSQPNPGRELLVSFGRPQDEIRTEDKERHGVPEPTPFPFVEYRPIFGAEAHVTEICGIGTAKCLDVQMWHRIMHSAAEAVGPGLGESEGRPAIDEHLVNPEGEDLGPPGDGMPFPDLIESAPDRFFLRL